MNRQTARNMDFLNLDDTELKIICPEIHEIKDLFGNEDLDKLGSILSSNISQRDLIRMLRQAPSTSAMFLCSRDYWGELKKEFYILVCTKDRKYADLRKQFAGAVNTTAIVGMISGVMGSALGTGAGIITPLVALALYSIMKLGKNVWCKSHRPTPKSRRGKKSEER